jgi:hypothetical protein
MTIDVCDLVVAQKSFAQQPARLKCGDLPHSLIDVSAAKLQPIFSRSPMVGQMSTAGLQTEAGLAPSSTPAVAAVSAYDIVKANGRGALNDSATV